jgi:5,10-methylene-tetrahydrofolate dehydrogenase/methenyl tetrahydrofolate cyclohydrolase
MEKNLATYIKRLIELDSKAVEIKKQKDSEFLEMEANSRNELRSIDGILEESAIISKQEHDRIIEEAKIQVKEIDEAAKLEIGKLQASFLDLEEVAARDIWKQLLEIER